MYSLRNEDLQVIYVRKVCVICMKKNFVRIFAAMLALCCVLALTACTGGNDTSSAPESSATESETVDSSTIQAEEESAEKVVEDAENSEANTGAGMFSSIEEFVNSDEIQSQIEAMQTDEMGVTITGEGNKLIYTYTFAEGVDTEGMAESLESAVQAQASTFQSIASTLSQAVNEENPVVVVVYQDSEGNEIYSAEFAAE